MTKDIFYYHMRMSSRDWELLSEIMMNDNRFYERKAQQDWFFNQMNRFCREVAIPYLQGIQQPSDYVEKCVRIPIISMDGSDTFKIANDFAREKKKSLSAILDKYLIYQRLSSEEKILIDKGQIF